MNIRRPKFCNSKTFCKLITIGVWLLVGLFAGFVIFAGLTGVGTIG